MGAHLAILRFVLLRLRSQVDSYSSTAERSTGDSGPFSNTILEINDNADNFLVKVSIDSSRPNIMSNGRLWTEYIADIKNILGNCRRNIDNYLEVVSLQLAIDL